MTRTQAIGVMLIALGLAYALGYAAWLRRRRRHRSASVAVAPGDAAAPVGAVAVSAMGDYDGTTDQKTGERVTTAGLGAKGTATLLVRRGDKDHLVTIERTGQDDLLVSAEQLVGARREQNPPRTLGRRTVPALRLTWRGDEDTTFVTSFRPRFEEDLDKVESALWWHSGGTDVRRPDTDDPTDQPRPSAKEDTPS